ncbi:Uncharacterised protein [Mycoplasmopsis arginini]|nr:Uncharacterised protein [Chlamydia abortus]SGA14495.1 Uncharacterised protein [Mycoplasmopsis arginini]SGA25375.1 Uncharacterised protein [Mycoplasmopsis arginini]SGA30462.1 Uncharacterised protein [Chlamydia abortus]SGA33336.1 Uncharacterised protein [Chlamydia abortus]
MFSKKDTKNLFYIIMFFLIISLLVFGINFERIMLIASKQNKNTDTREKLLLYIALTFTSLI